MEVLTLRSPLVCILVLATLAVPSALAIGEEVVQTVDDGVELVAATVDFAHAEANDALFGETRQEEAAREEQEANYAREDEPAPEPAREQDARPAPRDEPTGAPGLLRPVTRLVPLPVTGIGAAPRLDLHALTSTVVPDARPAPSRVPAPAPVAAASASAPAAPEAVDALAPTALVAAAAVTATAAAPSAAGAMWERLRRVGVLAVLYSRIAKERLLDHGSRERLLDAIRAQPGLAVADLAERTNVPRNTVTYHLRVLEREGLVSSTRHGRNRLFFAPGSLPQRENADAFATLRHETTLAVARAIGDTPGVDQKALCARVGLSPSLAHWHADRLVATGLVDKRREGRYVRYYPGASYGLVTARAA